ncbi:MAG: GAF domain-containing protein, partial [Sulfurimonas sp.]|nr:GAF domain-containing protein [Sulfurimonas sp.]
MGYESTYKKLADFGRNLLSKTSLVDGLPLISKYAKEVIGADRCSIFINDLEKNELWTTLADGVEKKIG